jgi:hypothetical protein
VECGLLFVVDGLVAQLLGVARLLVIYFVCDGHIRIVKSKVPHS